MAQQLIFDLKALLGERYPSISEFPPSRFVDPAQLRKRPATNIAQTSRILLSLRLPDSLIDLEGSENLLASNPIRSNPCLCGKPQRKQPWDTHVKVKLLLPPRQSRGNSQFCEFRLWFSNPSILGRASRAFWSIAGTISHSVVAFQRLHPDSAFAGGRLGRASPLFATAFQAQQSIGSPTRIDRG